MKMRNLLLGLAALTLTATASVAQDGPNTLDGVYSAEQAARGKDLYADFCSSCHANNLTGTPGGPGIAGVRFNVKWGKKSVGELYTYIHDNMPAGSPGLLTETEYLDVIAYILEVNKYPAGEGVELTADIEALNAITIGTAAK